MKKPAGISLWLCLALAGLFASSAPAAPAADAPPVIRQASDLLEWGRWKEARALLGNALADPANGQNAPMMAFYAHVLMGFGDGVGAVQWSEKAVATDDRCASCHLYLSEALGERAKRMSEVRALMQLSKIKKELERAGALDPQLGDVHWGWIRLELDLPAAVGGSVPEAFRHADLLSRLDPVDGHIARATIAQAMGHRDRAIAEFRAAADEHPNDPRGAFCLGQALFDQSAYAAAAPLLEHAYALEHRSALYAGYLAANLIYLRKPAEARPILEAANEQHPDSRLGAFLVAKALQGTGQDVEWGKALITAYLAVPAEPDQPNHSEARTLLARFDGRGAPSFGQ